MRPMSAARRAALEAALFDFERAPSRHLVALRQPAQLFESVREILQLAGGKAPDEGGLPPGARVVDAACFFVRNGILHRTATHYGVLGLQPGADAAEVKERYRQVVRLLHPDVAVAHAHNPWPADAAGRVNLAYEVLSAPERRQAYDQGLNPAPRSPSPGASAEPVRSAPRPSTVAQQAANPQHKLRWLATAFGAAGMLAVLGIWLSGSESDKETLVQRLRSDTQPAPSVAAPDVVLAAAPAPPATAQVPETPPVAPTTIAPAAPAAPDLAPAPPQPQIPVAAPAQTPAPPLPVATPPAPAPAPTEIRQPVVVRTATPVAPPAVAAPVVATPVVVATPITAPAPVAAPPIAPPPPPPSVAQPAPMIAIAPPAPAPAAATPAPVRTIPPAPTMADVHPHLARLLQQIEGGWGDRLAGSLEREVRNAPSTQALVQHYNSLVEGVGPVKVSNVDFKSQRRDERLVVTGQVLLQVRDVTSPTRRLPLQAEFVLRDGAATMTRLSRAPE